jgi:hypothetical protein
MMSHYSLDIDSETKVSGPAKKRIGVAGRLGHNAFIFGASLMRLDDGSAEGSAGQFHTTRWTLVLVLAQKEG